MTDVFRQEYTPLSDAQKSVLANIKYQAQIMYDCIDTCPVEYDQRMMALAKTNLEQVIMWAIKAIT